MGRIALRSHVLRNEPQVWNIYVSGSSGIMQVPTQFFVVEHVASYLNYWAHHLVLGRDSYEQETDVIIGVFADVIHWMSDKKLYALGRSGLCFVSVLTYLRLPQDSFSQPLSFSFLFIKVSYTVQSVNICSQN